MPEKEEIHCVDCKEIKAMRVLYYYDYASQMFEFAYYQCPDCKTIYTNNGKVK